MIDRPVGRVIQKLTGSTSALEVVNISNMKYNLEIIVFNKIGDRMKVIFNDTMK